MSDHTTLIICLNMILNTETTPEPTKMLIRQSLFVYGMDPQEITEGELRAKGIMDDRRQNDN